MAVLSRLRPRRSRRQADQPISGAEQLAEETGLPLLLEAPQGALAWAGEEERPAPSLKRAQLEVARRLLDGLPALTNGEPPCSVFVSEGFEVDDGVSPALALATVSALGGRRTLLAEVDFRRRRMSRELRLPAGPGIGDYLNRAARPQALLQPLQLGGRAAGDGTDPGSLVFIAAGEGSPEPMPPPTWDRFRHFVAKVTRAYEFVVLSGEPVLAPSQPGQLIPLVDASVVCVRPAAISREQARLAGAALHRWFPRTVGLVAAA
jgi:Mrp family chromosome partitioning ATPase